MAHIPLQIQFIRVVALSVLIQGTAYALPFTITASGTLPTTITPGGSATANFTVQNNTLSWRNNNLIKWLPINVTQITNGGVGTCGVTFNLAPFGQTGDSCTLQLSISGAVNGNDPDPHHHLFACFPGGITCAGTNDTLNVTVTSSPPAPPAPSNPRFAYVTNYGTPVVDVCSINPDSGPNPGMLTACTSAVTGSTTGTVPTINAQGITFNTAGTVAYITTYEPSPANSVFQCDINQTDGTFTACTQVDIVSPSVPNLYYAYYGLPAINSNSSYAFFVSYYSPEVYACPVSNGVVSGTCFDSGATGASYYAVAMSLNPANTALYIGNWLSGSGVTVCTGSGKTFNSCQNVLGDAGSVTFDTPSGIAFDSTNTHLYVADYDGDKIYYCTASQQSATQFTSCSVATSSISNPWAITVNAARTYAYVADYSHSVYVCAVSATDGSLSSCNPVTLTEPVDVALLY